MTGPRGAFLRGLGLGILAVSQPLYSLLAGQPGFFAARGADGSDIVAVCLLALFPALNWGAAAALGVGESVSAGAAAALLAGQASAGLPWPVWATLVAGAAAGAAWAARRERVREFLTYAGWAALLMPALFLARAPWPGSAPRAAAGGAGHPTRVVFVIFDEFPLATLLEADGAVDPVWFPAFAKLSREAAWYREARSVADDTFKAVPALLTGTYPKPPKVPAYRDYPVNLFTLLAGTHRLRVTETQTALCPPDLCRPERPGLPARLAGLTEDLAVLYAHRCLPRSWGSALPSVSHSWKGFRRAGADFSWDALNAAAGETFVDRGGTFRAFAAAAAEPGRPALHFLHVMLPHPPWVTLPSGDLIFNPNEPIVLGDGGREDRWEKDPAVVAAAWQRHILQARAADRLLGGLTDGLKKAGAWDAALVVVAADHGAAFRPGEPRRALSETTLGEVIPVPLFVKFPGEGPRGPVDRPASLVDVLPTVLEAQGLKVPEGLDGDSLRAPGRPPQMVERDGARRPASAGWTAARREADRRRAVLGDGRDPTTLYRLGPAGAAVGRRIDTLRRSNHPDCTARLDQALYSPTPYSKAFLSGRVECPSGTPGRRSMVAVVDGVVVAAGVTGQFYGTGDAPFKLMLPEEAVRGSAPPELFLAWGSGPDVQVSPVSAGGWSWRLEGGRLVCSDGRYAEPGLPVKAARAPAKRDKDILVFQGDARRDGRTPEEVVVLRGPEAVYSGAPDRLSGRFDFALPRDIAEGEGLFRVFAVRGSEAWELLE
ncbi:hypothetical protein EPO15_17915 [bacterium]|nr:MAG: hypothetical protein EPO15_17915 [bacterium]